MSPLPPGPPPKRRLSLAHARNLRRYVRDPLGFVQRRFERYGDLYLVRTGGRRVYVLRHPEHFAEVLLRNADAFQKRDIGLGKLLGSGLLTSEGALWKARRRMIQPSFTKPKLARYGATIVAHSEALAARWTAHPPGPLDLAEAMRELTLSIVARSLFSHQICDEDDRVAAAMREFQTSSITFDPLPAWLPTPKHRRFARARADMDALIYALIDRRLAERERGESGSADLLDALLDARDPQAAPGDEARGLEREAIRDELITLYLAGHETTANALAWAWALLARHPEVEARLLDELHAVLGESELDVEQLDALPYLRAVCCEVLRLYPPAYVIAREARVDTRIGAWELPAGSALSLWIYMAHHDPRWFPDPERFEPERFLHPRERPKLAWMPFGGGARMCVGKHFALIEMQLILASLIRRVRVELEPGELRARPRVTLSPAGGLLGRVAPRS